MINSTGSFSSMVTKSLVILTCSLLISCGGNGSSSDGDNGGNDGENVSQDVLTGAFLDSAVSGITYTTNTQNGTTNQSGEFSYIEGEMVTFSIGDLSLPPVIASPIVSPLEMSAIRLLEDNTVTNIATLLQSLDTDRDVENGIEIPEQAILSAVPVNFNVNPSDFIQDEKCNQSHRQFRIFKHLAN